MFPNPAITGTAIVNALDEQQAAARQLEATDARAALDEADLHEMERADYYDDARAAVKPAADTPAAATPAAPRRSLIDRLLRR